MTEPGQNLTLLASASPGSYMALLAVDQSVTLLGDMNDITQSQVKLKVYNLILNKTSTSFLGVGTRGCVRACVCMCVGVHVCVTCNEAHHNTNCQVQ